MKTSQIIVYIVLLLMSTISMCSSCKTQDASKAVKKTNDSLISVIAASNEEKQQFKDQILLQMEMEGLKSSRRTLYDWNSVVRTVNRPDDLLNQYNNTIDSLTNIQNAAKKIR